MGVAVRRARNVTVVEVDDAGKVLAIHGNEEMAVALLVEQYKLLSGTIGADFCRQAAAAFLQTHPNMQLPAILN